MMFPFLMRDATKVLKYKRLSHMYRHHGWEAEGPTPCAAVKTWWLLNMLLRGQGLPRRAGPRGHDHGSGAPPVLPRGGLLGDQRPTKTPSCPNDPLALHRGLLPSCPGTRGTIRDPGPQKQANFELRRANPRCGCFCVAGLGSRDQVFGLGSVGHGSEKAQPHDGPRLPIDGPRGPPGPGRRPMAPGGPPLGHRGGPCAHPRS